MSRINLDDNLARNLRLSGASFNTVEATLQGTYRIANDGPQILYFNPNGTSRVVFLPQRDIMGGQLILIGNNGTDDRQLRIFTPSGVELAQISNDETFIFVSLPSGWQIATRNIREVLTLNRTYFVDDAFGSDTNSGTSPVTPFKTIQKAIDTGASLDFGPSNLVVINVAAGTYPDPITTKPYVGIGPMIIQGADPGTTIISTTNNFGIFHANPSVYKFSNLRITTAGTGFHCILCSLGARLQLDNIDFGPAGGGNAIHVSMTFNSVVVMDSNYKISGSAQQHISVAANCSAQFAGRTITITGTPAFAIAFLQATQGGVIAYNGNTFVGTCTGASATVSSNGVIDCFIGTNVGAAAYLPGDHTFTETTGGRLL